MTLVGADFSAARPGGAALAAAGVVGVGRYLSYPGSQYGVTDDEIRDYKAHGIDTWLVREKGSTNMLGGYDQGVADATESQALLENLTELRHDIPLYTACDFEPVGAQLDACAAYQAGWRDTLGLARSAAYGGGDFLYRVIKQDASASLAWQAAGWAGQHSTVPVESGDGGRYRVDFADIYQVFGNVQVPETDKCLIFSNYYGQNGSPAAPIESDDEMQLLTIYCDQYGPEGPGDEYASTGVILPSGKFERTSTGSGDRAALQGHIAIATDLGMTVIEHHVNNDGYKMSAVFI